MSSSSLAPDPSFLARLQRVGLWIFIVSIVFSLAGTLALIVRPSLMAIFGPYYESLVKTPTWTYMALLALLPLLMYGQSLGWTRVLGFAVWGCLIGGLSELIGTTTGLPFGPYRYTEWLGPKAFGHVPYFIPLSWFAMSLVCLDLAGRATDRRALRVILASLYMVLWDVSLDPAMSRAFPFWTYGVDGFFYGMPASNWAGWFIVSVIIVAGYEYVGGGVDHPHRQAPLLFALNCFFPFMLCLLYGLYVAFFAGVVATAIPLVVAWRNGRLFVTSDAPPAPPARARIAT